MKLLRNNKIIDVDIHEDRSFIIGIKSLEMLKAKWPNTPSVRDSYIKDEIVTMEYINEREDSKPYVFRTTQSPYSDGSGLNHGYGTYKSKGEAIINLISNGFKVYNNGIEITL